MAIQTPLIVIISHNNSAAKCNIAIMQAKNIQPFILYPNRNCVSVL